MLMQIRKKSQSNCLRMVQTCSFQIQFNLTNLAILYEAWWPHSYNRLGLFHKDTSRMCNTCKLAEKPCFSFPALPVVVAVNTNMASLNCSGLKGLKIWPVSFFPSKPQMLLIQSLFFLSHLFSCFASISCSSTLNTRLLIQKRFVFGFQVCLMTLCWRCVWVSEKKNQALTTLNQLLFLRFCLCHL